MLLASLGLADELTVSVYDRGTLTVPLRVGWSGHFRMTTLHSSNGSVSSNHLSVIIESTNGTRLGMFPTLALFTADEVEEHVRRNQAVLRKFGRSSRRVTHTNMQYLCSYYVMLPSTNAPLVVDNRWRADGEVYINSLVATFYGTYTNTNEWHSAMWMLEQAKFTTSQ